MAGSSSSSSSIQKSFKYDVFLSFRGADTRKNFVDHLYQALRAKSIYTYKDDVKIRKGKRIRDELLGSNESLGAIEDSRFHIVVFSKNYASSSWCLKELVKIMKCHKTTKHTAYLVFFDVEPTEVRHQTGAVGEAFAKHENKKAAGKWRNALKEASDLAGWELKNTANGSEANFIKKIIEAISLEIDTINDSFDKNFVGMETRVHDIVSSLQLGVDDVRIIGIRGMGGAGKTTLARVVFDKISIQFEGKSFVENVTEVASNPSFGLKSLQQQILSDVLNDKDIGVSGVGDGKNILKQRMRGIKVLIALDDVDNIEQLKALAGGLEWFKSGSRIIITTRDEQVLIAHNVTLICDVSLLSNEEAICLFSRYAFGREGPVQGYEELSEKVVHYASGLPLTIEVLGSQLFGNDKSEWEDALKRLETIPLKETLQILEVSYTILENDQKEIFLDIACILKGWEKDKAIKALESCGFHAKFGLRVLERKSLITIDDWGCVGMHDHIEEMGRNIVRRLHPDRPHKHSRLWKGEEIKHILANDLGTEETRCMWFNAWNVDPYVLIKGLGKMKELRFLDVESIGFGFEGLELNTFSPSLSDSLRYLSLKLYSFRSLPKEFQANNLVTLKMQQGKLEQLWEGGEHKVLEKLRFLDLSHSKLRTLDLRLAPNLETLDLGGCRDLADLPDGTWTLQHLTSLNLYGCKLLKKLPEDLSRSGCLEKLDLSETKIKHLPDWICMLKHLKDLNVASCEFLEKLPDDIGNLECLENLRLHSTNIKHLPDSICMLKHLKNLNLHFFRFLEELPEDLGHLECLEDLHLSYTKIKHFPNSICKLKHLNSLSIEACLQLEKLPGDIGQLECLKLLNMEGTSISHLPQSILLLKGLRIIGSRGLLALLLGFRS